MHDLLLNTILILKLYNFNIAARCDLKSSNDAKNVYEFVMDTIIS